MTDGPGGNVSEAGGGGHCAGRVGIHGDGTMNTGVPIKKTARGRGWGALASHLDNEGGGVVAAGLGDGGFDEEAGRVGVGWVGYVCGMGGGM